MDYNPDGTVSGDELTDLPTSGIAAGFDPKPLVEKSPGWTAWIGPVLSLAMLVAVLWKARDLNLHRIENLIPASAGFWIVFLLYYFANTVADWIIFRRLWRIPPSGFLALLGKRISNEILLGYSGEVYFYGWARRRGDISGAPFGAIKDVAILSALAGNIATLMMLLLAWLFLGPLHLSTGGKTLVFSITCLIVTSLAMMMLRRHLFSLPREELRFTLAVHFARISTAILLTGLLWHLALPGVTVGWWLALATLMMLVSRLPLIPNKDIVFAGVAMFMIGRYADIGGLMALTATLTLTAHLIIGALIGTAEMSNVRKEALGRP